MLGSVELVFLLLVRGANPNSLNSSGDTPLHWLLKNEHDYFDVLRLLLHFGADVLQPDGDCSNTALHICAAHKKMNLYTLFMIFQAGAHGALKIKNSYGLLPVQVN